MKKIIKGYIYEAVTLPDTVKVDGKEKSTRNSKGSYIHPTLEGIVNFWKWFGSSKLIDSEGRPVIFYHGTQADFDVVDPNQGRGARHKTGMFLSNSIGVVNSYAPSRDGGNVMPVYVKAVAPVIVDGNGVSWNQIGKKSRIEVPSRTITHDPATRDTSDDEMFAELGGNIEDLNKPRPPTKIKGFKSSLAKAFPGEMKYDDDYMSTNDLARWARSEGHGIIVLKNVKDSGPYRASDTGESFEARDIVVVFDPSLVKSAVGNNGNFSSDLNITKE